MSKNLKTLICCILALVFVAGTLVAVFADSTALTAAEEESSDVVEVSSEESSEPQEETSETPVEPTTGPKPVQFYGDVNLDGKITAADARLALRAAAKLEVLSEEQLVNADVIPDGTIKANDARLILRVSAQLEPQSKLGSQEALDEHATDEDEIIVVPTTVVEEDSSAAA